MFVAHEFGMMHSFCPAPRSSGGVPAHTRKPPRFVRDLWVKEESARDVIERERWREGEAGGGMNMAYLCLLQSSRVWHQRSRAGDLSARHVIAQGLGFGV
jgi:hypothetical protein